jgi:hypothetical protein
MFKLNIALKLKVQPIVLDTETSFYIVFLFKQINDFHGLTIFSSDALKNWVKEYKSETFERKIE